MHKTRTMFSDRMVRNPWNTGGPERAFRSLTWQRNMAKLAAVLLGGLVVGLDTAHAAGLLHLIPCPDCGNAVSMRAVFCPKCGCPGEAIAQHLEAIEKVSRLPDQEAQTLLGNAYMGLSAHMRFFRERNQVMNVLTNQAALVESRQPVVKKIVETARRKIDAILAMGFTLNQIFTMRMDLINEALGRRGGESKHSH